MRVRIKAAVVVADTRKDSHGGSFETFSQDALLVGDEEVKKFRLRLEGPGKVYPAGDYSIGSESLTVNKYGSLELARVVLVPIAAPAK